MTVVIVVIVMIVVSVLIDMSVMGCYDRYAC